VKTREVPHIIRLLQRRPIHANARIEGQRNSERPEYEAGPNLAISRQLGSPSAKHTTRDKVAALSAEVGWNCGVVPAYRSHPCPVVKVSGEMMKLLARLAALWSNAGGIQGYDFLKCM